MYNVFVKDLKFIFIEPNFVNVKRNSTITNHSHTHVWVTLKGMFG
jgi:hypothetical protein